MIRHLIAFMIALSFEGPALAGDAFALFSPAVSEALKQQINAPEAKGILKQADGAVSRAPGAEALVHTEGTLPHKGIRDQSILAEKDWPLMLACGLAYRLTGKVQYLQAEERYLIAWLDVYQISFNPIDETNLDQMIIGYNLTQSDLTTPTETKMHSFLRRMAEGYLTRIAGERVEDTANWQSHRIKLIVLSAYALGDDSLIAQARAAFQRQVAVNIRPDGSVVDFQKRDALHYVLYDLEPLTMAAAAAKAHGEDWFQSRSADQPSVKQAIDWLTPFAIGQKTHEEFVRSTVAFDAARANAGEKGYSGLWDPAGSIKLYQLAVLADPKYRAVLDRVDQNPGAHAIGWMALAARVGL